MELKTLTVTLVADGNSDRALTPLLDLLLNEHSTRPYRINFADRLDDGHDLVRRVARSLVQHPCDILFVHRDAESSHPDDRLVEIANAIGRAGTSIPHVCVVPVRMTEAWLLVEEGAIRRAVGNPNGRTPLDLPRIAQVEATDAKALLLRALEQASELGPRRRRRFAPERFRHRVAELIDGLDRLRLLSSFARVERDVRAVLSKFP